MFNRIYLNGAAHILNAFGFLAAYMLRAEMIDNASLVYAMWIFVLGLFLVNMLIAMANIFFYARDADARYRAKTGSDGQVKHGL